MGNCCRLTGKLRASGVLSGAISAEGGLSGNLTIAGNISSFPGPYVYTPNDTVQIVPCAGYMMAQDIMVEKVPDHYGRIDWNGITLTVW